jgi:chromate transporter
MAIVTFGGAYAVLAYVAQAAVDQFGWLRPGEMLDGLGMAETTPGPLIMVTQFVGFLAGYREPGSMSPIMAATLGAILTTWVTFLPSFLWIFAGAPFIEKMRGNVALEGAMSAITAAVVGVILNLAVWFGLHVLFAEVRSVAVGNWAFDIPVMSSVIWPSLVLTILAALAIFHFRLSVITTLLISAGLGVAWTSVTA